MTLHYMVTGFVFKEEDRLDADRLFSVFTREFGRLEIYGKAIRKINSKLRSGLDVFSICELEFVQGKHKKTLINSGIQQRYWGIMGDPAKIAIAFSIGNLVDVCIKGEEKDQAIFDTLSDIFKKLNELDVEPGKYPLAYQYFFWNLMEVLGHGSNITTCVICANNPSVGRIFFSAKEGGMVCVNCVRTTIPVMPALADAIKIMRLIAKKEWDVMMRIAAGNDIYANLKTMSDHYFSYYYE